MTIKARKVGNSTVLPVPSNFKVSAEYNVYQGHDGQIIYTPTAPNPFLDDKFVTTHDFSQKEAFNDRPLGTEVVDDD
ncbi:type II toxin-antitoxin system PemI/MazE family antitoxin [Levilactobacillus tujiorum]|uniref:Antitoxin of toxin-antitoxin stability system n=1 Tax=Levilactobacillus tujiorum TaxID=2912243 RepID=A0ABX1L3X7_9LACO|nr:antitoxin of toxin-antitoxin stability system [Levilactobacillus tujiorum]MCH5464061.1 antitoxin of toxin-antitoxin stability system [Levilactobacillus tujiorum]NLR11163.1 antitoxin of toxin-antitoxin stability system [Lactobacillus sp. HBUAS51387]NLR29046.1 antitoxin of toxin-antitoxin stability system [Levilactobacillus tujiorum]